MLQNGRLNLDVTWHRRTYVRTYLYTRRTAYPTTATAGAARAAVASNNSRVKYATTVIVPGLVPETWWRTAPPPLLSPPFLSSNRVVHAFLSRSMARTKERSEKEFDQFATSAPRETASFPRPSWKQRSTRSRLGRRRFFGARCGHWSAERKAQWSGLANKADGKFNVKYNISGGIGFARIKRARSNGVPLPLLLLSRLARANPRNVHFIYIYTYTHTRQFGEKRGPVRADSDSPFSSDEDVEDAGRGRGCYLI